MTTDTTADVALLERVRGFLYREARHLDDREFERWLECYHPDAEFWMPAWADDGELTTDPRREISLIYYPTRAGLEDRVFRIRTDRSSATSLPEPRTGHNITQVEIVGRGGETGGTGDTGGTGGTGGTVDIRFNWFTLYYRYQTVDTYFGTSYYTLDLGGPEPLITRKKVVLKNDYVHHVVDVYHV
ncbi:benzoate 1,2-dioxygenase small subunit [Streptomyces sp. NPDC058953]|uniref:benzoate 1,2-dioxygenase small subunit n=1 Tax=unclassified Streptomyces TaxID=2593676 RepID=UPI0036B9D8F7